MPITDTVRAILLTSAEHPDHLVGLPERLPAAAQKAVVQSMIRAGLLEEVAAADGWPVWRTSEDGRAQSLKATKAGLEAVGRSKATASPAQPAAQKPARASLQSAAQNFLIAWDDADAARPALPAAVEALRAALVAGRSAKSGPRQPRLDTKRAAILNLLRRPEGATAAQITEATGWAKHTVHGFLAGLKKAGTPVQVLERVHQIGGGQGSKGSYTVYGLKEAN